MRALDSRPVDRTVFAFLVNRTNGERQLVATYGEIGECIDAQSGAVGQSAKRLERLGLISRKAVGKAP